VIDSHRQAFRLFGRDVRLVLLTSAIIGFTIFGGLYSVLLNLYLLRLGYDPPFVGQVNAAGSLCFALCSILSGFLGSRWGSRRTMICGMILAGVGHGLLPLAEFPPLAWRASWIMATYGLGVLGTSLYLVNAVPFLMGLTPPQARSHVFSTQVALWPLAGFAGSLSGGFMPGLCAALLDLSPHHPAAYRYPLLLAAALLLAAVLALMGTRCEGGRPAAEPGTGRASFPLLLLGAMGLASFFQMAAESTVRTFFNVYLDHGLGAPTPLIGGLTALGQLLGALAALTAPRLSRRWGRVGLIFWSSVLTTLCLVPLALFPHWSAAGLSCIALIAIGSVRRSTHIVFQQELVPARWRVTMSATLTLSFGMSSAGISLGGGYLIAALGYPALFLGSGAATLVGAFFFWAFFRVPRGEYAHQGAAQVP
jgi:MFS family permease